MSKKKTPKTEKKSKEGRIIYVWDGKAEVHECDQPDECREEFGFECFGLLGDGLICSYPECCFLGKELSPRGMMVVEETKTTKKDGKTYRHFKEKEGDE